MPRRVWLGLWIWLAVGATVGFAPHAFAQATFVDSNVDEPRGDLALADLLKQGRRLESERRWGEAYTLYEGAVREHPENGSLADRLKVSRLHYDLGRRYADPTFRDTVVTLDARKALDLYLDVLGKLQANYVHTPNWQRLAESGVRAFEQALTDPVFLERNLADSPRAKAERFRRDLRKRAPIGEIETRQQARDLAASVARLAHKDLGLSQTAAIIEFISGATNSLDPYSAFLTPSQLDEVYSQIEGNFVGLGVELKASRGALLIVKTIVGSPAERAGLQAGDRIVEIDGRRTADYSTDEAADMLQGEEGTAVELVTESTQGKARRQKVRREHVEVPSVDDARMVDAAKGVAYMRLTCFQKTTSHDVDVALWKLHRQNMQRLIVDLRGNPGGLLNSAVDVADKFLERGVIVSTRGRSKDEDYTFTAHAHNTWRTPLVVLIDGESASASEIFAGAIRDHKRGVIVGDNSYGKGSVQGIFPLSFGRTGLRLTTAKFYSPTDREFDRVGVAPDVLVHHAAKPPIGAETGAGQDERTDDADDYLQASPESDIVLQRAIEEAGRLGAVAARQTASSEARAKE